MPSCRTALLAVATALAVAVQADYVIEPSSVSLSTRKGWCQSETSTCPVICEDQSNTGAAVNTCDPETLTFGCLCNDNSQPNMSEYSLTLPFFVCQEWGNQCEKNCGRDSSCASSCRQDHPCGATNPTTANETNSTSTASATSGTASSTSSVDPTAVFDGPAGQSGSSSSSSGASGAPSFEMARLYAMSGTLGVFFMGFAYML